jgi:hypothetical protein
MASRTPLERFWAFPLLIALCLVWAPSAVAERAPLSQAELMEHAHLVVVGRIVDLDIKTERSHIERGLGNYDWAIDVTIEIGEVERGRFEDSNTIVARCFRIKSRKTSTEYLTPSGNHPIPGVGTDVRAYLTMSDGLWRVIFPNGLQPVSQGAKLTDAPAVIQLSGGGYTFLLPMELWILALVIGVPTALVVVVIVCMLRRTSRLKKACGAAASGSIRQEK